MLKNFSPKINITPKGLPFKAAFTEFLSEQMSKKQNTNKTKQKTEKTKPHPQKTPCIQMSNS